MKIKSTKEIFLESEKETYDLGVSLAKFITAGKIIFLKGELGAGKTTLVRGFLAGLGYSGRVRSPTFTLVESYQMENLKVHHFDFYRLNGLEEVAYLGLDDYFSQDAICFIEWPEKIFPLLPNPSLCCKISVPKNGKGRYIHLDGDENLEKLR